MLYSSQNCLQKSTDKKMKLKNTSNHHSPISYWQIRAISCCSAAERMAWWNSSKASPIWPWIIKQSIEPFLLLDQPKWDSGPQNSFHDLKDPYALTQTCWSISFSLSVFVRILFIEIPKPQKSCWPHRHLNSQMKLTQVRLQLWIFFSLMVTYCFFWVTCRLLC